MWAYASQLPQKEYKEWIEDGSTMEDVQIGPAGFDKFIKGRIPWLVVSAWALYVSLLPGRQYWARQIAVSMLSVLFCVLVDHFEDRLPLPPAWHFILFGAGRKFNKTDWNPTPVVPLLMCILLGFCKFWMPMFGITALQVLRSNRIVKLA